MFETSEKWNEKSWYVTASYKLLEEQNLVKEKDLSNVHMLFVLHNLFYFHPNEHLFLADVGLMYLI